MTKKNETKKRRRFIVSFIVIIILLLLIRSCSSEFDWSIGKLFGTSSEHEITDKSELPIVLNKNLKFDSKEAEISLNDKEYKITFNYKTIKPSEFTCMTSDATIATCLVKDGYVVVKPKKEGKVSLYVETISNKKIYKASMKINVSDIKRSLNLSSKSGMIVLSKTNTKIITYSLNNIDGEVKVKSSDEEVASATIQDGVILITGKKSGNVKITVSVRDKNNNKTYKVTYKLNIVDNIIIDNTVGIPDTIVPSEPSEKPSDKNEQGEIIKPNEPTKPSVPGGNEKPTNPDTGETPSDPNDEPQTPVVKDNNNYLKSITLNKGTLNPSFNKNTINYNVDVENNINSINVSIEKDSNKSSIKYIFNNNVVNNLNNLTLNIGDNVLKIEVTAEDNSKRIYTIVINRKEQVVNNYLSSLSIDGYNITPSFNKETTFYSLNVPYNENNISLNYTLEDLNSVGQVFINDSNVVDLSNINLNEGNNVLKIEVTDINGTKRIYEINIHRSVRTISFSSTSYSIYMEQLPYNISYSIYEDGIEINDYDTNDISLTLNNFDGTYTLNKGYISVRPVNSDIGKTINMSISYNGKTSNSSFIVSTNSYYISSPALEYDIPYINSVGTKNIIINNNLLVGNITKSDINNGFRLSTDNGAYIDVVSNNNLVNIDYDSTNSSNNSIIVSISATNPGESIITVTGNIFNANINSYNIKLNIIDKYNIVIDANGGFFDSVTTKYEYLLEKTETIDLSEFSALKVDDEENCLFFSLDSFNTNPDGSGTKYNKTDILTNFTSDLTLYAIYTSTSAFEELETNERLYLTEVDLFHNEEYYEKYNIDKIIYPGAEGAHVMSLTNNGIGKIKITGINLEEDTICISERKCINIGYVIKSALNDNDPYTYYYGSSNDFKVLNKDLNTTHTTGSLTGYHTENNISIDPNIEIDVGETKEISILWKWVNIDDALDTTIGNNYATLGDQYSLTVSIDFERVSNTCTLP